MMVDVEGAGWDGNGNGMRLRGVGRDRMGWDGMGRDGDGMALNRLDWGGAR